MEPDSSTLLIVDDDLRTITMMERVLTRQGYRVTLAHNGFEALQIAPDLKPDLILMDVMMPDMSGYETCSRLKQNPETIDIPIIFLTALNGTEDEVKAFSHGAVDFIAKPVSIPVMRARIKTHLNLRQTQCSLQEKNAELDAFARTVAHDLKGILSSVIGYSELLAKYHHKFDPPTIADFSQKILRAGRNGNNVIEELLLLAGVGQRQVEKEAIDMHQLTRRVLERLAFMIDEYEGEINLPPTWPAGLGYAPWIEEVWVNYISNGLKYGGQPPKLQLGFTETEKHIRFWVKDQGPGIPLENQHRLFQEFSQLDSLALNGHGLGLSIVHKIVTRMDGMVGVESEGVAGEGSLFYFTLPKVPTPEVMLKAEPA